jgi:uncharacterized protein with HEPN domain
MPENRGLLHLQDMLRYARDAQDFAAGVSESDFEANLEKQYAIVRAIEVIGEAAKNIPGDVRLLAPDIPWKQISAMRDKLIHHYFGVRLSAVWAVVVNDLPVLIPRIESLIERVKMEIRDDNA